MQSQGRLRGSLVHLFECVAGWSCHSLARCRGYCFPPIAVDQGGRQVGPSRNIVVRVPAVLGSFLLLVLVLVLVLVFVGMAMAMVMAMTMF